MHSGPSLRLHHLSGKFGLPFVKTRDNREMDNYHRKKQVALRSALQSAIQFTGIIPIQPCGAVQQANWLLSTIPTKYISQSTQMWLYFLSSIPKICSLQNIRFGNTPLAYERLWFRVYWQGGQIYVQKINNYRINSKKHSLHFPMYQCMFLSGVGF